MTTNFPNIDISAVATISNIHVLKTPCGLSNKLMRTLILPQFEPQTITRMVLGSIAPSLRFSALPSIVRNRHNL